MGEALERAWLRRGTLSTLLLPLALAYRGAAALHRAAYRAGLRRPGRLPVPVIVVGNVVAGGAGKTPVVIAVVEHLRARGLQAGVVSRGYGREGSDCLEVHAEDDPHRTGDEPLLIRRKADVPVFVAPLRADAGRALLRAHPGVQVIVSDDGLQHHALARDIEICVFDRRGAGNGRLLPAGPLREPWPRPVDLVLAHGRPPGIQGHAMERVLGARAQRGDGAHLALSQLRGQRVMAVAGIAQPVAFFEMLNAAGLRIAAARALPDHATFDARDPLVETELPIVCTEKDAVKLWRIRPDAWAIPLEVRIPPAFWEALDRLLDARLSSLDGSPPA
jgi:tetraacyldisaccharide 4'-kinase